MQQPIISVENLAKRYVLRHQVQHNTLRDAMTDGVTAACRRLFRRRREPVQAREDFWALRHVSFDVPAGAVLGIIGRNGAGKSTLLKLLSRITEPSEGRITLRGRVASLLEVGTGFHPELSGRENIFLNGAILGMRRREIQRKFDEIVAFAEVERFLDTPVKRYSSGMYVRLAFAVAAHLDPEILIVDEVLAVGDAGFQKKCLGKMRDVAQGGDRTVLMVSHNLGVIERLCDRTIWLADGAVARAGATRDVLRAYQEAQLEEGEHNRSEFRRADVTAAAYQIVSARVLAQGSPERLDTDHEVGLEIRLNRPLPSDVSLGLRLVAEDGALLLTSATDAFAPAESEAHSDVFVAHLPARTLRTGRHLVTLFVTKHGYETYDHLENVLVLNMAESAGPVSLTEARWPGLLNPRGVRWHRRPTQ